jgi:hypothetical protein
LVNTTNQIARAAFTCKQNERGYQNWQTNIMANQVKTPMQNYFEKVLYENLTFLPCGFLE